AEDKTADMGEERDSAARLRMDERVVRSTQLRIEPEPDDEHRREPEDDERERANTREREDQQVGAEHGSDRAARTHVRDARRRDAVAGLVQRDEGLDSGGGDPAGEIPEQVAHPSEDVLDVVPEDPEEEHVPPEVQPARV